MACRGKPLYSPCRYIVPETGQRWQGKCFKEGSPDPRWMWCKPGAAPAPPIVPTTRRRLPGLPTPPCLYQPCRASAVKACQDKKVDDKCKFLQLFKPWTGTCQERVLRPARPGVSEAKIFWCEGIVDETLPAPAPTPACSSAQDCMYAACKGKPAGQRCDYNFRAPVQGVCRNDPNKDG